MRNAPGPEGLGAVDSQSLQADWGGRGREGEGAFPSQQNRFDLEKGLRETFLPPLETQGVAGWTLRWAESRRPHAHC